MNGNIEVKSSLGQGATFVVALPLPVVENVSSRVCAASVTTQKNDVAMKILLVEDEPVVAEVLVGLLQAMGHHVDHAQHGLQALSMLAVDNFDLALIDLDLPGIDGLELARLIAVQGCNIPMAAITARADAAAEPAAMAAGMAGFIRKPVSTPDLAALFQTMRVTAAVE